jgi:hypothetical protein
VVFSLPLSGFPQRELVAPVAAGRNLGNRLSDYNTLSDIHWGFFLRVIYL